MQLLEEKLCLYNFLIYLKAETWKDFNNSKKSSYHLNHFKSILVAKKINQMPKIDNAII